MAMRIRVAVLIAVCVIAGPQASPITSGTIFLDPDIITPADPTTFTGLSYAGIANRLMFDRRVNAFVTYNAFLFNALFSDGLSAEIQVNPEFGTVAAAQAQAVLYATAIGRLPKSLRADVKTVWIHLGTQPFGGGNSNLLIHTGQGALYIADGILEETLVHEASHTSLDAMHAASAGWLAAQVADGDFISTYARDNPTREDIAESFLTWLAVRYRPDRISAQLALDITRTIPNRLAYFDQQSFNLFPVAPPPPDTTPPTIAITSPTSASGYTSSNTSLTIGGSGADNVGVTQVFWANSRGGGGTASGTTSWSANISLQPGFNVITVTARDAVGNTASDTLSVNYWLSDVGGDGLPDLVWRNYTTGANVVWHLSGTSVIDQTNLPAVTLAWLLVASADVNGDGQLDLIWRHGATGANVVWYLSGTTVVGQASLPTVSDLAWQIVASADVNRDGAPDLIWRNTATGANTVWYLSGTTMIGSASFPSVTDLAWQIGASADINLDGSPDLIWRNAVSGANLVWYLNGTTLLSQANLPAVVDPTWQIVAAFDVNRDQAPDLIWRNSLSGANVVWYLNGTTMLSQAGFPTLADLAWRVMGPVLPRVSTDINGDRHPDLVWRNSATGANVVWYLNGTSLMSQASLTTVSDLAWQIAAITDVNGDTHPDLVWRNNVTGANLVWYLNGTTILSQESLPAVPDLNWRIVGAADLNGDTHPDLIWRHSVTGADRVWYLNGGTIILSQVSLLSVTDLNWQIVAAADIDGDTHPDLVWRNTVTGANVVWYLNGAVLINQANLPAVADAAWKIVGAADIDGDGHPDLVWRNTTTGANIVWYLSGTALISQASLPSVADSNWTLRVGGA